MGKLGILPIAEEDLDADWSPVDTGKRLMNLRLKRGWTQVQLGQEMARYVPLAFKQNTISDYESGRRAMRGRVLLAAAQALNTTMDYLATGRTVEMESDLHPVVETAARIANRLPAEQQQKILDYIIHVSDEYNRAKDVNLARYRELMAAIGEVVGEDMAGPVTEAIEKRLGARA